MRLTVWKFGMYDILIPLGAFGEKMDFIQNLLNHIYSNNLTGGEFLNYLYKVSINGNPSIKNLCKNLSKKKSMHENYTIITINPKLLSSS